MREDFTWIQLSGLRGLNLMDAIDLLHSITQLPLTYYIAGQEVNTVDEVTSILAAEYLRAAEEDYEPFDEVTIYIGGDRYSNEVPVVEIEEGRVARWYRSDCWD